MALEPTPWGAQCQPGRTRAARARAPSFGTSVFAHNCASALITRQRTPPTWPTGPSSIPSGHGEPDQQPPALTTPNSFRSSSVTWNSLPALTTFRCCAGGGPPISSKAVLPEDSEEARRLGSPNKQVDVPVRPRNPPEQEVERPTSAQPAVDSRAGCKRRKLTDQLQPPRYPLVAHPAPTFAQHEPARRTARPPPRAMRAMQATSICPWSDVRSSAHSAWSCRFRPRQGPPSEGGPNGGPNG